MPRPSSTTRRALVAVAAAAAAVAPLTASATPAAAVGTYHNARYGFSVPVPAGWTAGRASANGDGQVFASGARHATMTVYGSNVGLSGAAATTCATPSAGHTVTVVQCLAADRARQGRAGTRVTYTAHGTGWYVISGRTRAGATTYEEVLVGSRSSNTLLLVYPASRTAAMDATVRLVARGFHAGNLARAH